MTLRIYRMGAIYWNIYIDSYEIHLLACFSRPLNIVLCGRNWHNCRYVRRYSKKIGVIYSIATRLSLIVLWIDVLRDVTRPRVCLLTPIIRNFGDQAFRVVCVCCACATMCCRYTQNSMIFISSALQIISNRLVGHTSKLRLSQNSVFCSWQEFQHYH